MADCFMPDIRSIQSCTEAFDKHFKSFVNDQQYKSACRVVSTAIKCFHEVKTTISLRCREQVVIDEYQRAYIEPLVHQSKQVVTDWCTLYPVYQQYFNGGGVAWSTVTAVARQRLLLTLLMTWILTVAQ